VAGWLLTRAGWTGRTRSSLVAHREPLSIVEVQVQDVGPVLCASGEIGNAAPWRTGTRGLERREGEAIELPPRALAEITDVHETSNKCSYRSVKVLSRTASMTTDHLSSITSAFENVKKPPLFVSGTWTVPKDVLQLFFKSEDGVQSVLLLLTISPQ
jgi:hypothetical protein